ncbi:MAG: hypothetical protein M3Y87_17200 [Myxococcota bacterium]|nr:hypothetical protein [Myxococcota bacterium]
MDDAAARRAIRARWPSRLATLATADDAPTMEGRPLAEIFAAVDELSLAAYALAGKPVLPLARAALPTRLYRRGEDRPASEDEDPLAHGLERRLP